MCRAVGASIRWLTDVIAARLKALPDHWHVPPMASPGDVIMGHLQVEADEMWSFVQQNANKPWVWIAMDKQTRHIMACHMGEQSRPCETVVDQPARGVP